MSIVFLLQGVANGHLFHCSFREELTGHRWVVTTISQSGYAIVRVVGKIPKAWVSFNYSIVVRIIYLANPRFEFCSTILLS